MKEYPHHQASKEKRKAMREKSKYREKWEGKSAEESPFGMLTEMLKKITRIV